MRKYLILAWFFLVLSIGALWALAAWNYYQTRHYMFQRHAAWVDHIGAEIDDVRQNRVSEVRGWPWRATPDFKQYPSKDSHLVGLFYDDTEFHRSRVWRSDDLPPGLATLDARLVSLQLSALQSHTAVAGPVLHSNATYFTSVVVPLDDFRVIAVIFKEPIIAQLLEQQARFWNFQTFVLDPSGSFVYAKGDPDMVKPVKTAILAAVAEGRSSGWIYLKPYWQWAITYHEDHNNNWLFVAAEPVMWLYLPTVFFFISLLGLSILAFLPWWAARHIAILSWKQDLENFAKACDRFIRGRDAMLYDPQGQLKSAMPLVHTLRWVVPQWKKAEAFPRELALERKLVSLLIESLPEGILFFNAVGTMQLGNELGKVFLALQQEAGKETKIVNGKKIPRGFLEPYLEPVFLSQQRTLGKEVEVSWADGKHLYRIWVESVQAQDDHIDGFIIVIRDITFRKQWEYVQEQVLSGITHDLRGPLSAVMGYLDLIKRNLKEDASPKIAEYVRLAREGGQRLSQMVSDILDVVRFEQGKIDLETQALSIQDIFKRLKSTFDVNAGQKNVKLVVDDLQRNDMTVSGDPKLLQRVFDNLVGNAIKFTPTGGTITVTAQRIGNRVQFTISDTGRGIPKEAQSRIFDKFQQVRPGDRAGGYGLGLAVAKFIVDAHKGEIHVESEPEKGSTFTFSIPDAEPSMKTLGDLPPAA